jgi:hypothetical protein
MSAPRIRAPAGGEVELAKALEKWTHGREVSSRPCGLRQSGDFLVVRPSLPERAEA